MSRQMEEGHLKGFLIFAGKVALVHTLTYFVFGLIMSNLFDYGRLFQQEVIRDFMRPIDSSSVFLGPLVQPIRGASICSWVMVYPQNHRGEQAWVAHFVGHICYVRHSGHSCCGPLFAGRCYLLQVATLVSPDRTARNLVADTDLLSHTGLVGEKAISAKSASRQKQKRAMG